MAEEEIFFEEEKEKTEEAFCEEMIKTSGMRWRVSLSIIMGVGWLAFLILWLAFYASDFNIYQNIAVVLASILIIGGILGAAWASWGMKYGRNCNKNKWEKYCNLANISPGVTMTSFYKARSQVVHYENPLNNVDKKIIADSVFDLLNLIM